MRNPPRRDVADLVAAARRGDVNALGSLYDCHSTSLFRTAYRLCGDSDDAQDAVHDLFVGLPEALRHYEERGTLDAWLKRIVVRLVLMRRRGALRRREEAIDRHDGVPSPLRTEHSVELQELRRVIDALPEALRDVFILKQIEGYSHDEIASLLEISAGASRVRLTRALNLLRRSLQPRG